MTDDAIALPDSPVHAVLMAGGPGSRFWPRSRRDRPKPLLSIGEGPPLLRRTLANLEGLCPPERTWVVTGEEHVSAARSILPELPPDRVLGEPLRRDTAACIGLAAVRVRAAEPSAVCCVLPTDHEIRPAGELRRSLAHAARVAAASERIVTLGLVPDHPSTAFGYIRPGEELPGAPSREGTPARVATAFHEKPDEPRARELMEAGCRWNAGIFVARAADLVEAVERHLPDLAEALRPVGRAAPADGDLPELVREAYEAIESISFDHGVMEGAADAGGVAVVDARIAWRDLGTWPEAATLLPADEEGNATDGLHVGLDTSGCVVATDEGTLVGTVGVEDLIVVRAGDAVLVCPTDRAGEVKDLVREIARRGLGEFL